MTLSMLPILGLLQLAAGALTIVLGKDAASTTRHKANSLAWFIIGAGAGLFICGSFLQ
jgi:hypothetical protein